MSPPTNHLLMEKCFKTTNLFWFIPYSVWLGGAALRLKASIKVQYSHLGENHASTAWLAGGFEGASSASWAVAAWNQQAGSGLQPLPHRRGTRMDESSSCKCRDLPWSSWWFERLKPVVAGQWLILEDLPYSWWSPTLLCVHPIGCMPSVLQMASFRHSACQCCWGVGNLIMSW